MSDKYFIDTNIFVYCFDAIQEQKKQISLDLIGSAIQTGEGMLSWQVVQEFLHVSTRKFQIPMKPQDAGTYLQKVLYPLCKIFPDMDIYHTALSIHDETQYSFYDSLIIAGAMKGGCRRLYTEDMSDGQSIGNIVIDNPFRGCVEKR